ncbi:MAG: phosphate acetyltransferase [Desulfovibrio sp.]|nr:phosphate acetyltransferase [Desulfovibrio sp.]
MKHSALYITSTGANSGKSAIALGTMQAISRSMQRVAIFRPIIDQPQVDSKDRDILLLSQQFRLEMDYLDMFAYTAQEAKAIINRGSRNLLIENIIQKYKTIESTYDFTLCIGTDFLGKDPVHEFDLNADIAANLGCPVMLVSNGENQDYTNIVESLRLTLQSLQPYGLEVLANVITHASLTEAALEELRKQFAVNNQPALIYAIPNDPALSRATLNDIVKAIDAQVLAGKDQLDAQVGDYLIAAMQVNNFLGYLEKDQLIITPGDRTDIILASIAAKMSSSLPDISGIVLTGGLNPPDVVTKLITGVHTPPVPILLTKEHTYRTLMRLQEIYSTIEPGDTRKINTALGLYDRHVNSNEIISRLLEERVDSRMTPMMFEFDLIERARNNKQRIVLAEGDDERILRATDVLLRRDVADLILLGNIEAIRSKASALNLEISGAKLVDPVNAKNFNDYAHQYYEYRKAKGITEEHARDIMADATYYGTMMVKLGDADGMVSGAVNTTAHTIRPAFEFIKTKPGFSVVSSVFLMCLKDRVLVFGDCAVNPNPTAQQLAEIAIASAHTAKVFGIVPRVAMLSYSTGTSGKGADVDVVVEATKIAREMAPDLALEGPLQYDAAIDPIVARTKLPGSQVAGKATVFIFPDLNTGNNTYKAVQRAADAVAIGPVLQGLNKPVNDLSRGCLVPDIVNTVAITAIQAASEKNPDTSF